MYDIKFILEDWNFATEKMSKPKTFLSHTLGYKKQLQCTRRRVP